MTFKDLVTGHSAPAILVQFGVFAAGSLLFTYFIAFTARRWTYIRSHRWILIDVLTASALILPFYQACLLLLGTSRGSYVIALLLASVWMALIDPVLRNIDAGRALIDTDPASKVLYRTDYRLARLGALSVFLFLMYAHISS